MCQDVLLCTAMCEDVCYVLTMWLCDYTLVCAAMFDDVLLLVTTYQYPNIYTVNLRL
jgi:hypothetical protein